VRDEYSKLDSSVKMNVKSYQYNYTFYLAIILTISFFGCKIMKNTNQKDSSKSNYFSSPAEAIPIITELLEKNNFKSLARYYDLSNSEIKLSELESGDFFIRKERPEIAHPAEFWHYKHPFAPGFKFKSVQTTARDAIYIVEVSISIDQGPASPRQIGLSYFYMIKSDKGWKILPDQVDENEHQAEMPHSIQ
jgi:hypothetical protein